MELEFIKAQLRDIEMLTALRSQVLIAANELPPDTDMSHIERNTRKYYRRALADGSHAAYIALDGSRPVAAGAVCFFGVMPTFHNPTGQKAYIMNMYTHPEYRRRGIASRLLTMLIDEVRARGITALSLEATQVGRPLYEKHGFVQMENELELPERILYPRQ